MRSYPRDALLRHVVGKWASKIVAITKPAMLRFWLEHKRFFQTVASQKFYEWISKRNRPCVAVFRAKSWCCANLNGLPIKVKPIGSRFDDFERKFLMGVPGYNKLKLAATLMVGDTQNELQVVALRDGSTLRFDRLLIASGGKDFVIPPSQHHALFKLGNEPKQFYFSPESGHNDLFAAELYPVSLKWLDGLGRAKSEAVTVP